MFNSLRVLGYTTPFGSQEKVAEWSLLDDIYSCEKSTPARIQRGDGPLYNEVALSVLNPDVFIRKGSIVAIDQNTNRIIGYRNDPFCVQVQTTIDLKSDGSGAWVIIDRTEDRLVVTRSDDGIIVLKPQFFTEAIPLWWTHGTSVVLDGKRHVTSWVDITTSP